MSTRQRINKWANANFTYVHVFERIKLPDNKVCKKKNGKMPFFKDTLAFLFRAYPQFL